MKRKTKRMCFYATDLQILIEQDIRTCRDKFDAMMISLKKAAWQFISLKEAAKYLGFEFEEMIDFLNLWA